ncbi:relaxin receptor 1-like [Ostrea edulis]|uniref:relaxin receptor 1-like n=1 Tax=Ostrea edulis TaxID=37623 RepID=UPI0024AF8BAC|nr:relaxin receptor 1-like [Ostrea edulis]
MYHLASLSNNTTLLPSLKLPRLRFVSTGSCIHLQYRSEGIHLKLSTAAQTLTRLTESSVWKSVKVNIRPEPQNLNYEVLIAPIPSSSTSFDVTINFISVLDKFCEGCFSCFTDGLCIESSKFCDLKIDCPDLSDEKNCAFECYHKNYYAGFRKETSSLQQCANNRCMFGQRSRGIPGCLAGNKNQWAPCNVPECGELFALSQRVSKINESLEDRAVLYSTIQPVSTEFGCITMKYSGHNVNFDVFITNGTTFDPDEPIFYHQNVQTDKYISTSFQTPTDVPYMVIVNVRFESSSSSIIRLLNINHETGICKDRGPCNTFQFQCNDGNCIDNINVCDNISHCPEMEDELLCKYKSNACYSCLETLYKCPSHCTCQKLVFRCDSLQNVSKEARALDLSSSNFDVHHLNNFSFLVHLNLSACFKGNISLKNLGSQLGSKSLQSLDISYNSIHHIETNLFEGMQELLYLNISYNCIKQLELDFLTEIPKLRHLISKNSEIEIIRLKHSKHKFSASLERIDFTGNRILKIAPGSIYFLNYLTKLILTHNVIANTDNYFSDSQKMLTYLDLNNNSIHTITSHMFVGLSKLKELNVENNEIEVLDNFAFSTLISLRILNLAFNKIHTIRKRAMENLVSLIHLNLTGNLLLKLPSARFVSLIKLRVLDLSKNGLRELDYNAFKRMEKVKYLYIQENELIISKTMFQGLCNLEWLWTDSYIICCAKPMSVDTSKCISPRDSISSCEQLISTGFLAQMIWFMALFSFVGNLYVIYYRIRNVSGRKYVSQEMFILNLSFSDFLMGVYLFIIAIADLTYRNVYGFNDDPWRSSATCTIAGLLATVSSEASVLFVFLITVERFIVLKYPFSLALLERKKSTLCVAILVWITAIALAAVPLSVYPDFYSRSTVCISLPLTAERVQGWEYSTFVFIGFNMLIFIAVVLGQMLIYVEVKRIGNAITNDTTKREIAVFKSLSYVVLSDTFCWIPIILIGLLAHGGVQISSDVYAWVVVLVLPINSALNPFIYTFSMIYKKTVIACYAPTEVAEEDDKDIFYEKLQELIETTPRHDILVVLGDLNANVGNDNIGKEATMGMHGRGERNNNGERLVELCEENSLVIEGTIFKHRDIHKQTWTSPDGHTNNQIDHIIINRRWRGSLQDVRVKRGADIDSDYSLVIAKIKLKTPKRDKEKLKRWKDHFENVLNRGSPAVEAIIQPAKEFLDIDIESPSIQDV